MSSKRILFVAAGPFGSGVSESKRQALVQAYQPTPLLHRGSIGVYRVELPCSAHLELVELDHSSQVLANFTCLTGIVHVLHLDGPRTVTWPADLAMEVA